MILPAEQYGSLDEVDWSNPVNLDHRLNHGLYEWWLAVPGARGFGSVNWRGLRNRELSVLTNMDPATDWGGPFNRRGGYASIDGDGSDDYIAANIGTVASDGAFTFRMLARPNATTAALRALVRTDAGGSSGRWAIYQWSDNRFHLYRAASGVDTGITATAGRWYHFVLRQPPTTGGMELFIDGVSVATDARRTITTGEIRFLGDAFSQMFNGKVDNISYWNRYLSTSEIGELIREDYSGNLQMLNRIQPRFYMPVAAGGGSIALKSRKSRLALMAR